MELTERDIQKIMDLGKTATLILLLLILAFGENDKENWNRS